MKNTAPPIALTKVLILSLITSHYLCRFVESTGEMRGTAP